MNFMKTTILAVIAALTLIQETQAGLIEFIRTHDNKVPYIVAIIGTEQARAWEEYQDTTSIFMPLRKALRQSVNRTDSEFFIVELTVPLQDSDTPKLREQIDKSIQLAKQEAADLKEIIFIVAISQPDLRSYVISQLPGYIYRSH